MSSSPSKPGTPDATSKDTQKRPPRGIAGSYLDSLSSSSSNDPSPSKPVAPQSQSKGIAGNSYLESLSNTPQEESSSFAPPEFRQPMGAAFDNPYVQEKVIEYELEVDPSAVVRRILAVREQLSAEWIRDLDALMQLNDDIMEAYEEYMEAQAAAMEDEDDASDSVSLGVTTPSDTRKEMVPIFDANAWHNWTQSLFSQDRDSSPFRKKNFDLLLLLSTQESVHRVLKSYKEDDSVRPETYEWLLDFYKSSASKFFDGHGTFGRANEFLEEILKSPPTAIETDTKVLGVLAWINPAKIAEDIVRERSEVALDWLNVVQNTPEEHTDLRRLLFTNMVSKAEPEDQFSDTIISTSIDTQEFINQTVGAFE